MLSLLGCLLMLWTTPTVMGGAGCGSNWQELNGKCYRYYDVPTAYADAVKTCNSIGANLAWLTDYTESTAVRAFIAQNLYWSGAELKESNSSVIRVQGSTEFLIDDIGFWGMGQPDLNGGSCVALQNTDTSKIPLWVLKDCNTRISFLCQRKCASGEVYCGNRCATDPASCYEVPPSTACDANVVFSSPTEVFQSTGYVDTYRYPRSSRCIYRFTGDEDELLKIKFDVFSMSSDNQDFIEIYTGSTDLSIASFYGRFSQYNSPEGEVVFSTNNQMVIVLVSDGQTKNDGRGFSIVKLPSLIAASSSSETISVDTIGLSYFIISPEFNSGSGELPSFSGYWTIKARSFIYQLQFWMDNSTLLDNGSLVEVFGSVGDKQVLLASYSKDNLDFSKRISISATLYIKYSTTQGPHWDSRGFRFHYGIIDKSDCLLTYKSTYGELHSPGYNLTYGLEDTLLPYPINYRCTYRIQNPSNRGLTFWFQNRFGLDDGDSIEIKPQGYSRVDIIGPKESLPESAKISFPANLSADITFTSDINIVQAKISLGFSMYWSSDCPDLMVSKWTNLSKSSPYPYTIVVQISCMQGYEFQDDGWSGTVASIQCLMGGLWNVSRIPTCQPVFCGRAPQIPNGYVSESDGLLFGDVAIYKCYGGRRIIGNENITCLHNKSWSARPSCSDVYCSLPVPMNNYTRHVLRNETAPYVNSTRFLYGSVVEIQCSEGYYIDGVTSISCVGNNLWSNQLGNCTRIRCPFRPIVNGLMSLSPYRNQSVQAGSLLSAIENSTYFFKYSTLSNSALESTAFMSKAYIWCREGFVVNGTSDPVAAVTCLSSGSYDKLPGCVDFDECSLRNGSCQQMCINTEGSYSCDCAEQFDVNGTKCNLIPGCIANPDACDHHCINQSLPRWYSCECQPPHVLYRYAGAEGWPKHSYDTVDEQLRVNHSCVLPQCPLEQIVRQFNNFTSLLAYSSNDTLYPRHYNDSITVRCARGYTFSNGSMLKEFTCFTHNNTLGWYDSENGSLASQQCQEVRCNGSTSPLVNVRITSPGVLACGSPFNYNITSICDLDPTSNTYKLMPDQKCPEVDCGTPKNLETLGNTNLTVPCTKLGCSFDFVCINGTQPSPPGISTKIVCQENGLWNYSSLYCEGTSCRDPGYPPSTYRFADASLDPSRSIDLSNLKAGGRLYYKCIKPGYALFYNSITVNHTECNGTDFNPPIYQMKCADVEEPIVESCPKSIEVLKYSTYQGHPFDKGEFLGYPSPIFTDNTGIAEIDVIPPAYHRNYIFDDDENVTFIAYDFNGNTASCTIAFKVVEVLTPNLVCSDIHVQLNSTHPYVNVTRQLVRSYFEIYPDSSAEEVISISVPENGQVIDLTYYHLTYMIKVNVARTFYSGVNKTSSVKVSSQCRIAVIPEVDPCEYFLAPQPVGANRTCGHSSDGMISCNYTCTGSKSYFLSNRVRSKTATSYCKEGQYDAVPDCVENVPAVSSAYHLLAFQFSPTIDRQFCLNNFSRTYSIWLMAFACDGFVDVTFESFEISYSSEFGLSSYATILFNPLPNYEGYEQRCHQNIAKFTSAGKIENLNLVEPSCFNQIVSRVTSILDPLQYRCTDSSILVGSTDSGDPAYVCASCPSGTEYKNMTCVPCPPGQFEIFSRCLQCPPETTSLSFGQTSCDAFACPPGYVSPNGYAPCKPCDLDYYSHNTTTCMKCPNGTSGLSPATPSVSECYKLCPPGYRSSGNGNCSACPVNFYQRNGTADCERCPEGQYTNNTVGQTQCRTMEVACPSKCLGGCLKFDGVSVCSNGCKSDSIGSRCDVAITDCDRKACDERGSLGCNRTSGQCICNRNVANGAHCDNFTMSLPGCLTAPCSNGGECLIEPLTISPGANLTSRCLCSARWHGIRCTIEQNNKCGSCNISNTLNCTNQVVRPLCHCKRGFSGYFCDDDIDGCASSPCLNGGTCRDKPGSLIAASPYEFSCACLPGFAGPRCEFRLDDCIQNPCGTSSQRCVDDYRSNQTYWCLTKYFIGFVSAQTSKETVSYCQALGVSCKNGGRCVDDPVNKFRCECPTIYNGMFCQNRIDYCNEGVCGTGNCSNKESVAGYLCSCPAGYFFNGFSCVNLNECIVNTGICNGGACVDTVGSFYCKCNQGFDGKYCETNINECLSSPCIRGECIDSVNDFICLCPPYLTGKRCETERNLCGAQCQNGGKCFPAYNRTVCSCSQPSYGEFCESVPDMCANEMPCAYGGLCKQSNASISCDNCLPGYKGLFCQEWTNECTVNPCRNNGTCVLKMEEGFSCACPQGFTGSLCETAMNPCSPNPCPLASTCVRQGFTNFLCTCPPGFIGVRCDAAIDANFSTYIQTGGLISVLNPTSSPTWTITKFTLSAWIRPDVIFNSYGVPIDILHLLVETEVILRVTTRATHFNGQIFSHSIDPTLAMTQGVWTFFGVSIDTINNNSSITIYYGGSRLIYLSRVPAEKLGRLNIIHSPTKEFQGYVSQCYLWAGASFRRGSSFSLSNLVNYPRGAVITDAIYQPSFIHYFWSLGTLRLSPLCEIVRTTTYCTVCRPQDIGTYLSFGRSCPSDIVITTSSAYTSVTWDAPIFLNNGKEVSSSPPNILPGSTLGAGKYKVTYSVAVNGKELGCSFYIFIRYGCDGFEEGFSCFKPFETLGYSFSMLTQRFTALGYSILTTTDISRVRFLLGEFNLPGSYIYLNGSTTMCITAGGEPIRCTTGKYALLQRPITSADSCALPTLPSNVILYRKDKKHYKYELQCKAEPGQILVPSKFNPKYISCTPEGVWDYGSRPIAACGPYITSTDERIKIKYRYKLKISFVYYSTDPCSGDVSYNVLYAINGYLTKLREKWKFKKFYPPLFCCSGHKCDKSPGCKKSKYALSCFCPNGLKRAVDNGYDIGVALDELPQSISENGTTVTPEQLLQQAIASGEMANAIGDVIQPEPGAPSLLDTLQAEEELDCLPGYGAVAGECVPCEAGYYEENSTCTLCPIDTYQPYRGDNSNFNNTCLRCPQHTTTYTTGASAANQCYAIPPAGYYFSGTSVLPCPLGFYQSSSGQRSCIACPIGTSTESENSTSISNCTNVCPSGQDFNSAENRCKNCAIGSYRDANLNPGACLKCPAYYTTATDGSVSSANCSVLQCPIGTQANASKTGCEPCPLNAYSDRVSNSTEKCTACARNGSIYITNSIGKTSFSDCMQYCENGYELIGTECVPCKQWQYKNNSEDLFAPCKSCSNNKLTLILGANSSSQCIYDDCPPGYRINGTSCIPCGYGLYQPDKWQKVCIQCPDRVNYTTVNNNSTTAADCIFVCPDGSEAINGSANGSCAACKAGSYRARDLKTPYSKCQQCPEYFTTPSDGAVNQSQCTILKCPIGKQDNNTGGCEPCPLNTYSDRISTRFDKCKPCGANFITESIGKTNASDCFLNCSDVGFEANDSNTGCVPCKVGSYKSASQPKCIPCSLNYTTAATGSTSSSNCSIVLCDKGQYREARNETCIACPVGSYQNSSFTQITLCTTCVPASSGANRTTATVGSKSATDCRITCEPGYEPTADDSCVPCKTGSYKTDRGAWPCTPCLPNVTTANNGSTKMSDCSILLCEKGQYKELSNNTCISCAVGFYQDSASHLLTSCNQCGASAGGRQKTTLNSGSKSVSDCLVVCPVGYETDPTVDCKACPVDFYSSSSLSACQKCPEGYGTNGQTAQTACAYPDCVPGEERNKLNMLECLPCPKSKYNPLKNGVCTSCPTGKTTTSTGSKNSSDCLTDCSLTVGTEYNSATGKCDPCPIGTFGDKTTVTCQKCPPNKSTTSTGLSTCNLVICPAGQYAVRSASTGNDYDTCTNCSLNTYQPRSGQIACINCPSSTITLKVGASVEADCLQKPKCSASSCDATSQICEELPTSIRCRCKETYDQSGERCIHICSRPTTQKYCHNDGVCNAVADTLSLLCTCQTGYSGSNCSEFRAASASGLSRDSLIIAGVVAGVTLLIAFITAVVVLAKGGCFPAPNKPYKMEFPTPTPSFYGGQIIPIDPVRRQLAIQDEITPRGGPTYIE